ncbi:fumarate reductase flavoprotein subunit FccA [Thermacetogenium phaeum DSM 12270]|uniref:Fumarate reductase flavoprotein subunit FccA n=1 Tax=Thermacetogenium phaeum (strain ATCC BAA-254 / DSM 26808 / PB) TaxID=1089553 RepID=K4LX92_THEPS|nr:FAD-dependent oxidoreductase [Thermacetogenium phaeum]AFV12594.1 fumarate reductase flavoprotein subunit FccA [Thermacetogenium phaeum DSM 12270]
MGKITRRTFIKGATLGSAGLACAGILAGCGRSEEGSQSSQISGEEAKPSFMKPPAPIADSEIKETVTTDVVVCGAGMAGLCAAIAAAEGGAKVVLLEKGNCTGFRGMEYGAIGSRIQRQSGININRDEIINEVMRWGGYKADQRVVSLWADHSGETMDWIVDMGKKYGIEAKPVALERQVINGTYFKYYPTVACEFIPNEEAMAQEPKLHFLTQHALRYILESAIKDLGVDLRFKTPAVQLIRKGEGRVTGVIAKNDSGYIKFNASKGVILCTGDYANDPEMLKTYIPSSENIYGITYPSKNNTGDGHKMGLWVGAAMDEGPHAPMYFDQGLDGMPPGYKPVPLTRQPWLGINILGERFANEDLPYGYVSNSMLRQPGCMKWVVWDAKWPEEVDRFGYIVCKEMKPPLHDPKEIDDLIKKGIIKSANTIDELAQKMEVPVETFKATVARYNELAKLGKDLDFGKRPECLTTLEKAPFYAAKLAVCLLVTLGGLKVNEKLQVLDKENKVIPGLYAAGNTSGNFFFYDYPINVCGISHGRALTFGRLAGMSVMQNG